jgi:ribosomal protein L37AE/L43A
MIWIVLWIGFSILASVVAANKGRSALGFFFLALLLSPLIGLIAALVVSPNRNEVEKRQIENGDMAKCPFCAELIRAEARVCKHCGKELASPEMTPTAEQWDKFVAALKKKNN